MTRSIFGATKVNGEPGTSHDRGPNAEAMLPSRLSLSCATDTFSPVELMAADRSEIRDRRRSTYTVNGDPVPS